MCTVVDGRYILAGRIGYMNSLLLLILCPSLKAVAKKKKDSQLSTLDNSLNK